MDIFVRDIASHRTTRISVSSSGVQGNADSYGPSLSADGRFVAFTSWASNLVPNDTNRCIAVAEAYEGCADMFVHDRRTGTTVRVSVSSSGRQGNYRTEYGVISTDGRHVAFTSWASNLVPNDVNECSEGGAVDEPPGCPDVFVHDLDSKKTELVSVKTDGSQFQGGLSDSPTISRDGSVVAFVNSPDRYEESTVAFVRDRTAETTTRVPDAPNSSRAGGHGSPRLTADGRTLFYLDVPYACEGPHACRGSFSQIFSFDRRTGASKLIGPTSPAGTHPNGAIFSLSISPDGRFAAFVSGGSNIVPGDTNKNWDAFLLDIQTGTTTIVSLADDGSQAIHQSYSATVSGDGRLVAWDSGGENLVPRDTNQTDDVFLRDTVRGRTSRVSIG